ncbi:MAG: DUF885 domain-containing protein [Bacteroidetes bacterium]|nr:DUF885 domain-containing protein [Bacteroidota bacterium]MBL0033014.1 DUF885 domain-containing protein [Bacteroidota bacterium]
MKCKIQKATFIALFFLSSAGAQIVNQNNTLHQLFKNYYEDRIKLFPLEATAAGDNRYNNILPNDGSQLFLKQVHEFYSKYQNDLSSYKPESLNQEDRISFYILKDILNRELEGEQFHKELMPFAQFFSLPLKMGQLGSGTGDQPFKTVKDYDDWLQRMDAFSVWTDTTIANFRKGIAAGIVLPKVLVLKMIPQMEKLSQSDTSKNVFYGPVKHFPAKFSNEDKNRLTIAYNREINEQLIPSYKKLHAFFSGEYLNAARSTSGINALPNGDAMYRYYIYYFTTTHKTPEEIYQTGLTEVSRITAEMEKLKNQMGYTGTLKELFNYMQTDKQFMPFKTVQEVLDSNRAVLAKIQPQLQKLFSVAPKTPFEIREVESFRAAAASPQYNRSSADGTRPGIYYIPILDPAKINTTNWPLEATFLHEAIPGHHYQISLLQENTSLPEFRRFSFYPAFAEGWALYCESLGEQLGCYTDPYQRMGAYGTEIHRAIRLVVDVGLHTGKMTREDAIKYMMDKEAISEQIATQEIERYIAMPGQALSYKTGELKIKELRDKYKKELGAKFNLMSFHDAILKGGNMPLNIFEIYMDEWAKKN